MLQYTKQFNSLCNFVQSTDSLKISRGSKAKTPQKSLKLAKKKGQNS